MLEAKFVTATPVNGAPSMPGVEPMHTIRLGVVAVDPLRAIGLGAILEETLDCTIHTVPVEAIGRDDALAALVLDASADSPTWTLVSTVSALYPRLPLLVLGDALSSPEIRQVHAAGAKGYLSNTAPESEIRECVATILGGEHWPVGLDQQAEDLENAAGEASEPPTTEQPTRLRERLTPRECEVMDLLLDGRSNREIAASMKIDEATVKAHLGRMLRKAGCSNRVELTLLAIAQR